MGALIRELKHRVALCSLEDVVDEDGTMRLRRSDVVHMWAKIEPKRASQFARTGYAIDENRRQQSHLITMRMRRDIDISAHAWIYEERLQSANRWFKVLGTFDLGADGEFVVLSCRLYERGEDTTPPIDEKADGEPSIISARPVPHGVKL